LNVTLPVGVPADPLTVAVSYAVAPLTEGVVTSEGVAVETVKGSQVIGE